MTGVRGAKLSAVLSADEVVHHSFPAAPHNLACLSIGAQHQEEHP
jgi:hypothetical protein